MVETAIKTHLIITDIHEEYHTNWCGKLLDTKPVIKNGEPVFVIIGSNSRIEIRYNIWKKCAKTLTRPICHFRRHSSNLHQRN